MSFQGRFFTFFLQIELMNRLRRPLGIVLGISLLILWGCSSPDYSDNEVIMYSQTTCNYCTAKRELLTEKGIPFEEHFIDTSTVAKLEMYRKLQEAGLSKKSVGTPVIEVNGHIMPGNPSLEEMEPYLKVKSKKD